MEFRKEVHNRYKFENHHHEVLAEAIKGRVREEEERPPEKSDMEDFKWMERRP